MTEALVLGAVCLAGLSTGIMVASVYQLKTLRDIMVEKIDMFDDVTKKACEANQSMAAKLLQVDGRLDSLESLRGIMGAHQPSSSTWKK